MNEIRTTKIDGVEFVTLTDYLRLKEENEKLQEEIKNHKQNIMQDELEIIPKLEEENINLKSDLEQFSEAYKRYRDYEKEELAESCYDLERENQKLKDEVKDLVERNIELNKKYMLVLTKNKKLEAEKQELEYLGDINEELKEENKKMKERIKELEATNKKRTADNWATFKS